MEFFVFRKKRSCVLKPIFHVERNTKGARVERRTCHKVVTNGLIKNIENLKTWQVGNLKRE